MLPTKEYLDKMVRIGGNYRRSNKPEDRMDVSGTTTSYLIRLAEKHYTGVFDKDGSYLKKIIEELKIRGFTKEELIKYGVIRVN